MMAKKLRPHQEEACDAAVRLLTLPASGLVPLAGLRCQIRAATGSGKSLTAVHVANRLYSERTLVLVPSLPLLEQTVRVWQEEGHGGLMVGLCSLKAGERPPGIKCTTDPAELVAWTKDPGKVTVFATYASLGLGHLEEAHQRGLKPFSLAIGDEAHRVSGHAARPWAAILDNTRIPCDRRLFMTATPRLWAIKDSDKKAAAAAAGTEAAELIASMDDEAVFGPVASDYPLGKSISDGTVAPYRIVCVDVSDPVLQGLEQRGVDERSLEYRGARLAALQTGLLTACAEWDLNRPLSFHHLVAEARAMSTGLHDVARVLWELEPSLHPCPELIGTSWLEAVHTPAERRAVLGTFASLVRDDGWRLLRYILSSVKTLSEGVDTFDCDAVYFADVRGSMVDLVQAVGRALRTKPGSGKIATIVVPVIWGVGETGRELLTSQAYDGLSKILMALRAHDSAAIERLAMPQSETRPSREPSDTDPQERRSARAGEQLLSFSTQRDPALIAAFVRTRVMEPERAEFRRGLNELITYKDAFGDCRVPYAYRAPSGHRLGVWVADQRRYKAADVLDDERLGLLNELGFIWSAFDTAFTDNLTAVAAYATEHGHACPPADAVWGGRPVGVIMKNARTAQRRTENLQHRQEAGERGLDWTGALPADRKAAFDAIDPAWCPTGWSLEWQRSFTLACRHVQAGGVLLGAQPGSIAAQGEDLAGWARMQQFGWDKLGPAQQWMCEHVLGLEPLAPEERPKEKVPHAQKEARNLAAAAQYQAREGHLNVPRNHQEQLLLDDAGASDPGTEVTGVTVALGLFIANSRARKATIPAERAARLTELGMRWQ
ncbi:DEAD/DEAH box helicase family protein [Streptomyces sp. SID13666]|nr:DEAD/DEAH box helicase family protein [Streptomyces sp. SID13666]